MDLQPYIFFYGRCEEALDFYKKTFGGAYEMMRMSDAPQEAAGDMPAAAGNRVMHASFKGAGVSFMASDGRETKPVDSEEGNISLSLTATEAAEGERIFDALAQGGTVKMPLDKAFWGGRFGMVVDRFGLEWMLALP